MMKILKKTMFNKDCYVIPKKKEAHLLGMRLSISMVQYVTSQTTFHDILVIATTHLQQSTPVCRNGSGWYQN